MRVGLVCHAGFGGSARVAVDLANELAVRRHAVHLFARRAPFGRDSLHSAVRLHATGGEGSAERLEVDWPSVDMRTLVDAICGVAERDGLDVLHFHYALPFARAAADVRARLGPAAPATVGTLHGTDVSVYGAQQPRARALARWLSSADSVTTVSHAHAHLATRTLALPGMPEVIPNFVSALRFRPAPRAPGRPRIVHVSNFRAVKDPVRLARIFVAVRRLLDAELWLVGDGETLPAVRRTLRAAGVHDDARFFGLRRDVETILPQGDVLLMASRHESFSLAALEAQACGVPVVAPAIGGLPEVVAHGQTGLLYPPGNTRTAADAVLRLLADASLAGAMGAAAAVRAERFTAARIVPRYESLYRRVAARRTETRHADDLAAASPAG